MRSDCRFIMMLVMHLLISSGCARSLSSELTASLDRYREQIAEAKALNAEAIGDGQDPARQQELLERSLKKDDLFGEAHNNLGIVLHGQGQVYDSAKHFERATTLLPGSPRPLVNLALLHADLSQWDRALVYARRAYERDSHDQRAMQILALSLINNGAMDKEVEAILKRLTMIASSSRWRKWAIKQLTAYQDQRELVEQ